MQNTTQHTTVCVFTLGCKVNLYESRQIIHQLILDGYDAFEGLKKADVYVINTCAVTNEAERKSRQAVSRCLHLNPDADVIVCGCASQKDALRFDNPNVKFIKGNADKTKLLEQLKANKTGIEQLPTQYVGGDVFAADNSKTRAFVKIQDGCNNFCSYCIVPYLRGRSRSRASHDILAEISTLSDFKEIVLTGVDISDYDDGDKRGLTGLCLALKDTSPRIRFGSLEERVITDDFLQALKQGNFCDHFHLSLQSGSDNVLHAMNRHYTSAQYLSAVKKIREYFPLAGITTDIIVGYPTETDADFLQTCAFAQEVKFNDIHIFPFSPRLGTVAAKLPLCPQPIVDQRVKTLTQIKTQLKNAAEMTQLNTTQQVLTEEAKGKYIVGYTKNYTKVYLPKEKTSKNKILNIFITKQLDEGVTGDII